MRSLATGLLSGVAHHAGNAEYSTTLWLLSVGTVIGPVAMSSRSFSSPDHNLMKRKR